VDVKDISAWVAIGAASTAACVWFYRKVIKTIIRSFNQYKEVINNSTKIILTTNRVNSIIHLTDTPYFEADRYGNITNVNQSLINVFGADNEIELLGFGIFNFILADERAQNRVEWLNSLEHDTEIRKTFTIINRKSGDRLICSFFACINRDSKFKIINILGKISEVKTKN